ncbi:unnamed protein product [Ostreobium quekettii]|uniref:Cytochrome b5 heme-binding domain-containing protein n=1 Tax=Ostreobium quekettii TaxID=121088 RepID=A0A8S1IX79_9CHLO|nr:unnamed protein product [Ostreobium quekettii]|eukprot:evm.model.scf_732EXC.9 EVM.evm.TU.scf_732EXC.9   scf_732EXC:51773-54171(-)
MADDDDFSFPTLSPPAKVPLTAASTVVDRSNGKQAAAPVPVNQVSASRRPNVGRPGKVPLEKGYSQVEWMMKSRRQPNLTGVEGFQRHLTMEDVRKHNTEEDAWVVVKRKVYNISPYLRFHPGGVAILRTVFGKDASAMFAKYHPWVNIDALLQNCWVGVLDAPTNKEGAPVGG